MVEGRNLHFFPLTSLQIGDLQSYLSRLTIFVPPESKKFLIIVDNQPWLIDQDTRPAHLWQLMVTKSRLSPFANSRAKHRIKDPQRTDSRNVIKNRLKKVKKATRWFALLDAVRYHKKALLPMKKLKDSFILNSNLQHTLYGCIIFEVSWDQVRGINYLNELQTDTSMALEAKLMKRWEFDSMMQASSFVKSWFSGTSNECYLLQEYLDGSSSGEFFYDAQDGTSASGSRSFSKEKSKDSDSFSEGTNSSFCHLGVELGTSPFHTPPPVCGSFKRRKIMKCRSMTNEPDGSSSETYDEIVSSPNYSNCSTYSGSSDSEPAFISFEAVHYKDVLVLFRFSDPDLPFRLKKIIVSDLRLLTLLEYGLPSWVIFLQSYPVFCRTYRPWMCPLARFLYVLVSVATVLIGFYDLYKNVPVLKSTASRLCGPLFEWIESWEMISRIRYLGTMLFLHNFEKAVAWFLMISRAMKPLLSVLTKPIAGPILEVVEFLLPSWNICLEIIEMLSSVVISIVGSASSIFSGLVQIVVWPLQSILSIFWTIATSVIYPVFWMLQEILVVPFRLVTASVNGLVVIFSHSYYFLRDTWSSIRSISQVASATNVTAEIYQVSIWRSLWNDIFSQVFRAIRSILYGFIAFFAACNRHRLSTYNYLCELFLRLTNTTTTSRLGCTNSNSLKLKPSPSSEVKSPSKHSRHYKKKLA